VQTISFIKTNEIEFTSTGADINVMSELKCSKPGQPTILKFKNFSNKKLCIVGCLQEYISRTEGLRKSSALFVTTQFPYTAATSQTIRNWLKVMLDKSGVDVNQFSAHSYPHPSTSAAMRSGVPVDTIYKSAGWTSKSKMFARFYNRPLLQGDIFSSHILKDKK